MAPGFYAMWQYIFFIWLILFKNNFQEYSLYIYKVAKYNFLLRVSFASCKLIKLYTQWYEIDGFLPVIIASHLCGKKCCQTLMFSSIFHSSIKY